jgi:hypothetical protein
VLDTLISPFSTNKIKQGKLTTSYQANSDKVFRGVTRVGFYSLEYSIERLPDVVIHAHVDPNGDTLNVHWKELGNRFGLGLSTDIDSSIISCGCLHNSGSCALARMSELLDIVE